MKPRWPAIGRIAETPLACVMGALAADRFTGALRLEQDGRAYAVYWADGEIVDADSAAPDDTLARVALDAGLVDSAAVARALHRLARSPGVSPLDALREGGGLSAEAEERLPRLVLARRAARPFALADATFNVEERAHGRSQGGPLEPRFIVYRGLRQHTDEKRLERDLRQLTDKAIQLKNAGALDPGAFGFADEERIIVSYLQKGYWDVADLLDACMSVPRTIALPAVLALLAFDFLDVQPAEAVPRLRRRGREATVRFHAPSGPAPAVSAAAAEFAASPPSMPPRVATNPQAQTINAAMTAVLRDQIVNKHAQVEANADHFALLEVGREANRDQIKAAFFHMAKTFHPDRLALVMLEDLAPQVDRIFARLSDAFSVLGDDGRRKEYLGILAQGGEAAVKRRTDDDAARAQRILSAEENFRRGEMAMRRQMWGPAREAFKKAIELNPEEGEHYAFYAWSTWCEATDKQAVFKEVKKDLSRAVELNAKCTAAWYYMGQVHNQAGDPDRAYQYFNKVTSLEEEHVDAEREMRLIESRRQKDKKGGLFERFRKK